MEQNCCKVINEMSSFKNYVLSAADTAGATCKQHHACMSSTLLI